MTTEQQYIESLDIEASYNLAKKMEAYRTNPVLGYRPAGSWAEFETGEMLKAYMEDLGLSNVRKDEIKVDGWEFERAVLAYRDAAGERQEVQLGAYQTDFVTEGAETFQVVYVGKGGEKDYADKDVAGKIVLAEINQRDEWWINFPVYQAHEKGAKALIAVQVGGYGQVDEKALNAQDIAGPPEASAFSMSFEDSEKLKACLDEKGEITVTLDASSRVMRDVSTYNILGEIPGKRSDRMILLSAHYDSYFSGFQDDNTAVAMMLGIARAFIKMGYQPENTWVFCAMAAEEWGIADSKYDWSTGAYAEVFNVHPEWAGKVIGDFNFELPALSNGNLDGIRCTYEYKDFFEDTLKALPALSPAYPEGVLVSAPIETWSDDFSVAISGIPSMVNEFSAGSFMTTHYHSQYDSDEYYNEAAYRFHHELYGLLLMHLDRQSVAPLNFAEVFEQASASLDVLMCQKSGSRVTALLNLLGQTEEMAEEVYDRIYDINEAGVDSEECREAEKILLKVFKMTQDKYVRLTWEDAVVFPQEAAQNNLRYLKKAIRALRRKTPDAEAAFEALYEIDNNAYAFQFSKQVYERFTDYVLDQNSDRLQWGRGRIVHHENLYDLVAQLMDKYHQGAMDFADEIAELERVVERQKDYLRDDIEYMLQSTEKMLLLLQSANERLKNIQEKN
ncbi:M28 family peptidase [Coprococcus catus]|uniref:M28 family peptidase n=1 Tax=Coprococcus catus TaxID=116085 RepID=UPI001C8BD791|nr:M28 family peptidase [Coprococcus catus]MBX9231849.1 M28 family peptidase [Coprococcus catus]MCT6800301.1 M28 family peptidase [Coprococcus catus]